MSETLKQIYLIGSIGFIETVMTNPPILMVEGKSIAEVWEKAVERVWKEGVSAYTEYDQYSKDCTMLMVVKSPFSEPRIHRAGLCGSLRDLEKYVGEVVEGTEDHLVREGKRPYEYHERLFEYALPNDIKIDQVDYIISKLSEKKVIEGMEILGCSRRAQAITWKPWVDAKLEHPPCLQRIWCRIYGDELIMETCWRSRDAYKAAFWNMYALTELQKRITERLNESTGKRFKVGQYIDFTNSFHIYENDFQDIEKRFMKAKEERTFEERTMTSSELRKILKM
ncbi:MAG: thymidylate synthase [Thermoproteota archaeon]